MTALCPVCAARIAGGGTVCPKCKTDLAAYLSAYYAPDALVNEAIGLLEAGETRAAYDRLVVAHYLRPHDTEIVLEMSRCLELLGDFVGAMEKIATLAAGGDGEAFMAEYQRLSALAEDAGALSRRELAGLVYGDMKTLMAKAVREVLREAGVRRATEEV